MIRPLLATTVLLAACQQPDAPVGAGFRTVLDVGAEPIKALDILFVIDDSASMDPHQLALIESARDSLFGALAAEAGGMPDLHVAIVSSDVGAGPYSISGCNADGDEGRFQIAGGDLCGISGTFIADVDDGAGGRLRNYTGELADAFGCAAHLGSLGCGFEQHLASMRLALDGSNPENAGFLRDDALLLVVILADEDDCSAFDPAVFDTSQSTMADPLGPLANFRCFEFGVVCDGDDPRTLGAKMGCTPREDSPYLESVAPYVDLLHELKGDPSMVMVAGIFGDVGPVEVVPDPDRPDGVALADICPDDEGITYPAVRLHAVAGAYPARWVFAPICDATMSANLRRIALTTGGVMSGEKCLLGEVPADPVCRAFAVAPDRARRAVSIDLVPDPSGCGHTPSTLRAVVSPDALGASDRLVVECLGP